MDLRIRDTELFCERLGRGRPLLTMHGLGFDHSYFRPWLDPLASRAELVFYDHRGHGRSRPEPRVSEMTDDDWVIDADALREALGFDKIVLLGHSYGGCLAMKYALRYPERLDGLILCATAPAFDYPERVMQNAQARGGEEIAALLGEALGAPFASDDAFGAVFLRLLPVYFYRPDPDVIARVHATMRYSAAASDRWKSELSGAFDVRDRLAEIDVPTLVLGGDDDWITPPDVGPGRLRDGLPRATTTVLEGCGHFPFIEAQQRTLDVLGRWLEDLGS